MKLFAVFLAKKLYMHSVALNLSQILRVGMSSASMSPWTSSGIPIRLGNAISVIFLYIIIHRADGKTKAASAIFGCCTWSSKFFFQYE